MQAVAAGDTLIYTVNYQNISGSTLSNAVLNVVLPSNVVYKQSSQGLLTTNNTVAVTLGTLAPTAQGTMTIMGTVAPNVTNGNTLVAQATLAFTTPGGAQDSAIAYDLDNVGNINTNNLAGLALFGVGFFPSSLLGWILLLGIILVLILIARYYYHRANAQRMAAVGPAPIHQYYAAPAPQQPVQPVYQQQMPPQQPPMNTGTYQGDHLPH